VGKIGRALGYVDEFVWLLIVLAGVALTVVVIAGGGSVIEVVLVLVVTLAFAFQWAYTSNVWEWVRRRR
jgi:hypothetical protein